MLSGERPKAVSSPAATSLLSVSYTHLDVYKRQVEGVTFLYMQLKGLLEIRGDAGLIRPYVQAEGTRLQLHPV